MVFANTIGQLICTCKHDISSFLTIQIDGCRLTAGNIGTIEVKLIVCATCDSQGTIGCCSAHHITDSFRLAVVGCDVLAIDNSYRDTVLSLFYRIGHVDSNHLRKLLCTDGIVGLLIGGGGNIGRFSCFFVNSHLKGA